MKKKSLFALMFACVSGFAVFSCSSNDEEPMTYVGVPDRLWPYSDYIRDAKGETASLHYESWSDLWYLLDAKENRYYIFTSSDESNGQFCSLQEKGHIVDGANVKFDGKVYATNDEWREWMYNYLGHLTDNYGMLKREYHSEDDNWILPSQSDWLLNNIKDKTFVLMVPFNIERVE